MTEESHLRERICRFARSLYDRGLTHGSTGNISARLDDGRFLVTPTGSSFGFVDPADLSLVAAAGHHLSGDPPTKELPLHTAFYGLRGARAGAVVHLHSHHAVHLSLLSDIDPEDALPPLTPYSLMQLGRVRLLPYFRPGDPAMGRAVAELDPKTSAVILANHGPVVAGVDLDKAVFAMEELEATARLAVETRGAKTRPLGRKEIAQLVAAFDLEV
ncbi:MAG: aldolase [Phyllobacteriaceae bacterium]|nr:aldolase [Phyllobacteriaceae bacterium]